MVRKKVKKVKKGPARSKKSSKTKEVVAEYSVMEVGDLESLICSMVSKALAPQDTPPAAAGEPVPVGECDRVVQMAGRAYRNPFGAAPNVVADQSIGNQEANSAQPPKTLPEELQALHERMMAAFDPEMQAIEKRFGYAAFYKALALYHLRYAVRNMAAVAARKDPRDISGKPLWWDARDDDSIASAMHSRLLMEVYGIRELAKIRNPETFNADQFRPCVPATNS